MTETSNHTSSASPLLDIRALQIEGKRDYSWSEIVKGVTLTLHRGEVLGLIGESGAGKSTIGLAAMGYARDGCRLSGGQVLFDGMDLRRATARQLADLRGRRIAYVAQSAAASLNPAWRIIDQYAEGPKIHGIMSAEKARKDAVDLYTRMRLPDPQQIGLRYPHQVSGGQLQRAMTAMAMACRPDLIIFDEPTTALDVTTQIEVLGAIRDIVEQFDTAAIYITHDLAVVAQMADRIKVLRDGQEVEEAPTREMLGAPRQDYTKSLWGVRNKVHVPKPAPPETAVPKISVNGVSASYGTVKVLDNVSFRIHRGHTTALVGESGSGKSTMARVIAGLLSPTAGEVTFDDKYLAVDFRKRSKEDLRQIQMIYQMADTALNPRHTIRETLGWPISFFSGLRGRARHERIRELLRMIDLEPDDYIDRLPAELSGGQKQRIGIARALAANPSFIICDEITSALDQLVAESILDLLDRLQKQLDLTYMFITHDLATVKAIADDVVVMRRGKIEESGPTAGIFADPQADYTKLLLSSVPNMDPDWLTRRASMKDGFA
ncbi:ABC transporter ATP-binding protein [Paracoccus saliphilus]|uniref:ABC transporter ATP-binding protein n=1 Tax=Paracoccus saliphilus TaxID=405559 RepID=A0AA45W702_9RHOB|nr:ABC transporter ATP-binding protein [Paracoccus saliphilus]WCR03862.1 ABC transporter ATP-binding protein [Paracoccus saliphilus]SIT05515.1 peptide/nickel transport system ATP-binding protein [Paracoccus saliphilus]